MNADDLPVLYVDLGCAHGFIPGVFAHVTAASRKFIEPTYNPYLLTRVS